MGLSWAYQLWGHADTAGPWTILNIKNLAYHHPKVMIHALDIACARTLQISSTAINRNSTQIGMVKRKKLLEQVSGKAKGGSRFSSMQKFKWRHWETLSLLFYFPLSLLRFQAGFSHRASKMMVGPKQFQAYSVEPDVVSHICNPSTRETDARG